MILSLSLEKKEGKSPSLISILFVLFKLLLQSYIIEAYFYLYMIYFVLYRLIIPVLFGVVSLLARLGPFRLDSFFLFFFSNTQKEADENVVEVIWFTSAGVSSVYNLVPRFSFNLTFFFERKDTIIKDPVVGFGAIITKSRFKKKKIPWLALLLYLFSESIQPRFFFFSKTASGRQMLYTNV